MSDRPKLQPALGLSAIPAPKARPRPASPASPAPEAPDADAETGADDAALPVDGAGGSKDPSGPDDAHSSFVADGGADPFTRGAATVDVVDAPAPQLPQSDSPDATSPRSREPQRTTHATARTPAVAREGSGDAIKHTTVLLPAGAAEWLREKARQSDQTQVAVILDCIERAYDQLPALIARETGAGGGPGLFPNRPAARPAPNGLTATLGIRTTVANLNVIDGIVEATGARNRSHLVAVALAAQGAPQR